MAPRRDRSRRQRPPQPARQAGVGGRPADHPDRGRTRHAPPEPLFGRGGTARRRTDCPIAAAAEAAGLGGERTPTVSRSESAVVLGSGGEGAAEAAKRRHRLLGVTGTSWPVPPPDPPDGTQRCERNGGEPDDHGTVYYTHRTLP